jgi:hypothetical protein
MMDLLDRVALAGRRYEAQTVARSGSNRFTLGDLLETFNRQSILELTPVAEGKTLDSVRPDPVRKLKVSLLDDGVSAIHSDSGDWYEVLRTAPSGDISKVRIIAHSPTGAKVGELRMLVGPRRYDHYFREDPIIDTIERRDQ